MQTITVIVPVYNTEKYLRKCLDSICNQTYKNLEIVCVNDYSTDNSISVLNEYVAKDSRIKIINHRENKGASAARNSGIDVSTGEYIYFVDSDDWLDLDYIENMYKTIEKYHANMVLNTNILEEKCNKTKPFSWNAYTKKLPEGEFLDKITAINESQCMIWAHLYKREFLIKNNLRFPEGYIHEDEYFSYVSKILSDKLFAFYGPAYHYRQHSGSTMNLRHNKIYHYVKTFSLIYDFYKAHKYLNANNKIKIFRLNQMYKIETEQDFHLVKNYVMHIHDDFLEESLASSDMEKFMFKYILNSQTFEDYKAKVGTDVRFAYIRKYKLKQKVI